MSEENEVAGPHRVAAFLLSLERDAALEVMRHLDSELVSEIASAMTELGETFAEREHVDQLYSRIAKEVNSPLKVIGQSGSQLKAILEEAFGEARTDEVLEVIRERRLHERPFESVEAHPPEFIAVALAEETPNSAAIVLSHLDPGIAADVVSGIDPEFALKAVTSMATLVPPGIEILKSMARNLDLRLQAMAACPVPPDPSLRLKTIAEMLNFSSQELERSVLEGLEAEDESIVAEIREFMFTWTDLGAIDKRSMQKILASVDTRTLSIALKACAADVEENVTNNLSSRVKAMVVEERELAGAVPMTDVLGARGEILKAVHALIEAGEFQPARSGEDMVA